MSDTQAVSTAIERSQQLTTQSIPNNEYIGNFFLVNWLARSNMIAPPWWSYSRDLWLRDFWKSSDHLAGTVYTMQSKMTAIPVKAVPKDMSDKRAVLSAQIMTDIINDSPGFGAGWCEVYGQFVEDLLTTDNGGFIEIIGMGNPSGPVEGAPISLAHLDSLKCMRTGNATYPIIYTDIDGKRYKLHFSRVMFSSQMPSPISEMYGVGFCSVSRALGVSQNLIDIVTFKMEKLGSRPHREIVITKGGLDPRDLQAAFNQAESMLDSQGLTRYSKVVIAGSQTIPDASHEVIELSKLPDGFDEQTSVNLGMATIALAFGMDARELFPAMQAGATRADALLQHLKQRGKGPGQILQLTERMMNFKFMPNYLLFATDFQDDAQDRQAAEIRQIRANKRVQDTTTGAENQRTIREQMVVDGDITQEQFEEMELEDGRLASGLSSLTLLFKKNGEYSQYLKFPGVDNPLDKMGNDPVAMQEMIADNKAKVYETLANSSNGVERLVALECESALNQLDTLYTPPPPIGFGFNQNQPASEASGEGSQNGMPGRPPKPGTKRVVGHGYVDPRVRKLDLATPTPTDEANTED